MGPEVWSRKGAHYLLPKLKEAIKQLYHDHAAGKTAPTKEEFGKSS